MSLHPTKTTDKDLLLVSTWAASILGGIVSIVPLKEGNSKRQNFRVHSSMGSFIIYSPTSKQEQNALVQINRHFALHGIMVPRIVAWDRQSYLVMVEDLGTISAEEAAKTSCLLEIAMQASVELAHIHTWGAYAFNFTWCFKDQKVSYSKWYRERFGIFFHMLILGYLGINELSQEMDHDLRQFAQSLNWNTCHSSITHGDWHFRNLMYSRGKIYVLDWVGSQWGPIAADLASFFMHPYNLHSDPLRETVLRKYLQVLDLPDIDSHFRRQLRLFEAAEILRSLTLYACRARDTAPERAVYVPSLIQRTGEIFFQDEPLYAFPALQGVVRQTLDRLGAESWDVRSD